MDQTSDRPSKGQEFIDRLAVQAQYGELFVRCPACHGDVSCHHCIGTRRVSRATRRELVAQADVA